MVIENFRNSDPGPVYRRFDACGRMMPEGLVYVSSWVSEDLTTCWQVMETDDPSNLDAWIRNWNDLVDFTVIPVLTSAEARAKSKIDH